MEMYTPGGLKISLHSDRVERVLKPIPRIFRRQITEDSLFDIEMWANLPGAVLSISAIITAMVTQSWILTLIIAVLGFVLSHLYQQFFYSYFLKCLIPQFLGAWFLVLPASLVATYFLYQQGVVVTGIAQLVIVLAEITGIADILLLTIVLPIRLVVRSIAGLKVGDIECAFIKILNRRAGKIGIVLDWEIYNQMAKKGP